MHKLAKKLHTTHKHKPGTNTHTQTQTQAHLVGVFLKCIKLKGCQGTRLANGHLIMSLSIPCFSPNYAAFQGKIQAARQT